MSARRVSSLNRSGTQSAQIRGKNSLMGLILLIFIFYRLPSMPKFGLWYIHFMACRNE